MLVPRATELTSFYLIRHALTDAVGRTLAGRMPNIHLSEAGRRQADHLASRLSTLQFDALFSSPIERAVDTATPIARELSLDLQTDPSLTEIDFGEWTGKTFDELQGDPAWRQYNVARTVSRPPSGESLLEVQNRMIMWTETVRRKLPSAHILVVSHGDPIKTVIMYYAGLHLEMLRRFEISPASVSVIEVDDFGSSIVNLNRTD